MNESKLGHTELAARVRKLEAYFAHYHVNAHDGTDQCMRCCLDLRDPIHLRVGETQHGRILALDSVSDEPRCPEDAGL